MHNHWWRFLLLIVTYPFMYLFCRYISSQSMLLALQKLIIEFHLTVGTTSAIFLIFFSLSFQLSSHLILLLGFFCMSVLLTVKFLEGVWVIWLGILEGKMAHSRFSRKDLNEWVNKQRNEFKILWIIGFNLYSTNTLGEARYYILFFTHWDSWHCLFHFISCLWLLISYLRHLKSREAMQEMRILTMAE
jgi:hypothetical protein